MKDRLPAGHIRDLYAYWRTIAGAEEVPSRHAFSPNDIPAILPHVFMLDVLDGAPAFRFRLVGTNIVNMLGFDPTGKLVSDIIDGEYLDYMHALFRRPVEARRVIYSESDYKFPEKNYLTVKRLLLPFRFETAAVEIILVCQIFEYQAEGRREPLHAILENTPDGSMTYSFDSFAIEADESLERGEDGRQQT